MTFKRDSTNLVVDLERLATIIIMIGSFVGVGGASRECRMGISDGDDDDDDQTGGCGRAKGKNRNGCFWSLRRLMM